MNKCVYPALHAFWVATMERSEHSQLLDWLNFQRLDRELVIFAPEED